MNTVNGGAGVPGAGSEVGAVGDEPHAASARVAARVRPCLSSECVMRVWGVRVAGEARVGQGCGC